MDDPEPILCPPGRATPRDLAIVQEFAAFLEAAGPLRPGENFAKAARRVMRQDPERWSAFLGIPAPTLRAVPDESPEDTP